MGWTFYNSSGQRLSTRSSSIDHLDIDGGTDIGAAIVDADLFIVDDGAGGTNRKTAASRIKTYIAAGTNPVVILATGQDSRTSTTTFSDHNDGFQFEATAGVNYIVQMYLPFGGINDGGGTKIQLTVPSGASYIGFSRTFFPAADGTGHVNSASQWTTSAILAGGSENANNAIVTFRILNPSNTGNVTMQWAQNASSGNAVYLQTTAWMSYAVVTGT